MTRSGRKPRVRGRDVGAGPFPRGHGLVALSTAQTKNWEELLQFSASLREGRPTGWATLAGSHDDSPTTSTGRATVPFTSTPVRHLVQHQRQLTDSECNKIVRLYRNGVQVKEICQRFEIDKQRVREICKRRGIKPRTRGLNDVQKRQTEQLYAEGLSAQKIADRFNVADDTVLRYLHSIGTAIRKPGRPRRSQS